MKIQVRTFRWSGWVAPVMVLIALALIPFALVLALGLAAVAVGALVFRAFFPQSRGTSLEGDPFSRSQRKRIDTDSQAIDADFEVKEENEKR